MFKCFVGLLNQRIFLESEILWQSLFLFCTSFGVWAHYKELRPNAEEAVELKVQY
jgi:hypothetical protein